MGFLSSIPSINEGSFFFFFAFLLLPRAECQMKFTSIYQGMAVTGLVGSSVNFTWSFSGVYSIDWGIKRANAGTLTVRLVSIDQLGKVTFPSSSGSVDYNGRVNGIRTGDTSSGQVVFTLSNIKTTDANWYGCVLYPPSPVQVALADYVNLRVEELPRIVHPNFSQTTYNEGGRVSISCGATSTPEPDVRWIHNGQVKNPGLKTAQISFSPISRSDAGIYICRANNSVGTREKRLTVVVNYKPDGINLTTSAAHNTAIQGDDVTLTCTVAAANPQVSEYKFYLNDSKNAISSGTNIRSYTINGVQRVRDYGKYKCVAHNTVGDGQSNEVVLDIKVPAKIETLTGNVTVDEGNAINLTCDVSGYPVPTVTWQKDGKPFQSAGSGVIHIGRSTRQDAGTYICKADNRVAPADQKITFVTVNYAATITSISSSVSESWRGQTVRLRCASDGVPTPTLSWYTPVGTRFNPVKGKENTVDATMNSDEDFGFYNCTADNGFAPVSRTVGVQQIKAPGSPSITTTNEDIQATSLNIRWTAPTDDGGSSITAYRVVILQGGAEKKNENITDPNARGLQIGELQKDTNYTVKVFARNFVFEGEAGQRIIKTKFEGRPAAAEIIGLPPETNETKLSLKWLEPQNNGAAVEQYNVYQRTVRDNGTRGKWNKLNEIKKPLVREVVVQLSKGKEYEFVVTAINRFGESFKEEEKIKKTIVLGDAPAAVVFTVKVKDDEVTFKWEEPDNNGGVITKYSIYQRTTSDKKWEILKSFTEISKRDYAVKVQKGKAYEFVVTATNKFGESSKANSKKVDVLEDKSLAVGSRGGLNVAVIAGAAAAGVLLILGVVLFCVWWKRRKTSSDAGSSLADLRGPNPDDFDDGYHTVGATSAARQLQASGPAGDVTYAQVDMSQKKDKRPVTDVYAEVDKSKKTKKKPKKQPGELDYAELDDLRPNFRPAPQPGAAAKPIVRAPAYEGTEYADITQFGIPQPEPTYDNVPKKDVVYSNVESM